jgi:hypothetical protein
VTFVCMGDQYCVGHAVKAELRRILLDAVGHAVACVYKEMEHFVLFDIKYRVRGVCAYFTIRQDAIILTNMP